MIRAVIVDDEPRNVRILSGMISEFCPEISVAGTASNSRKGKEVIQSENPDLVFLDIEMPYGNAFDMLDKLQPVNFEIIFVTAFENYSLKAFKYSAIDYLLKPVNIEELQQAVTRVVKRKQSRENHHLQQMEQLLNQLNKKQQVVAEKIALPSSSGLIFVPFRSITRCEAKGGYTHFYRNEEEKIVAARNMKEYEELLPEDVFFRIHNSHIINLNFVVKYHRGRGGFIQMTDGAMLELASRRKDEFMAKFGIKN
jgi:two-component system, LytTR family, response regulator